ncbi:MAG TPA: inositol monophosphatase [Candidatus Paceibacterota bacterium]
MEHISNPPDLRFTAITAAKEAGKILMHHFGNVATEFKGVGFNVGTIVTKADGESEDVIVSLIKSHFPAHGVYGEEGTDYQPDAEYVWYVDPLDGTSNFVRNIPLFGVSIGIVFKGQPICGVLYFPALDLLVEAEAGKGAFANGSKITVSERPLVQALYYSGGKFGGKYKGELQLNPAIADVCGFIKIVDASSYEFAQIAMGDAEIYSLVNIPHDVVAGICIVREAGGVVTDGKGGEWALASKEILATTPTLHDELVSILNK